MEAPNLNYIKEISDGDVDFEENILNVLKKEFPNEWEAFENNFQDKNFEKASGDVHKIKHKISLLGLEEGLKIASKFENDLKKSKVELYQDFVLVLNKIHVYLKCK